MTEKSKKTPKKMPKQMPMQQQQQRQDQDQGMNRAGQNADNQRRTGNNPQQGERRPGQR